MDGSGVLTYVLQLQIWEGPMAVGGRLCPFLSSETHTRLQYLVFLLLEEGVHYFQSHLLNLYHSNQIRPHWLRGLNHLLALHILLPVLYPYFPSQHSGLLTIRGVDRAVVPAEKHLVGDGVLTLEEHFQFL